MSANKRILLNVIATYGRSLFGLVCGLFSARWVLEALGGFKGSELIDIVALT